MATKDKERIDNTIRCATCPGYQQPQRVRIYTKDDTAGWVTCAIGNTIKRLTMACQEHPLRKGDAPAVQQTIEAPAPKAKKKAKAKAKVTVNPVAEISDLVSGIDFDNLLQEEINKIGAKA